MAFVLTSEPSAGVVVSSAGFAPAAVPLGAIYGSGAKCFVF